MMAVASLSSACAVPIHEQVWYSPIPGDGNGAIVTHFFANQQTVMTENEWLQTISEMGSQGYSLECTFSPVLAQLKQEIEELCSKTNCIYILTDKPRKRIRASRVAQVTK